MSTQPKWCKKICNLIGHDEKFKLIYEKSIEVRKTKPKLETPFKVYIYCTKDNKNIFFPPLTQKLLNESPKDFVIDRRGNGKVIGEFVCDKIIELAPINRADEDIEKQACLNREQIVEYLRGKGYGWHISDLVIYDKPKELSEFFVYCDRCDKRPIACKFAYEESNENGYYSECMCDFKRPIERPPQSWCYVEELG